MCGLVYVRRKDGKPANRSVRKRYYKQQFRGSSGFGYVAIRDNEIVSYKRAPTEHEIMNLLKQETAPEILFHHRFPTSTPNLEEQAHPLFVEGGNLTHSYYIAHNGVIRNPASRKIEHEKLGFKYLTELKPFVQTVTKKFYSLFGEAKFNDSEALAVDTALALEERIRHIESEGAAAVIGLKIEGTKVTERFFYRNRGNPLIYHDDHVMTTLTSLGKGKEVEPIYIMRLKEDGSVEEHPAKVWTPWVYRDHLRTADNLRLPSTIILPTSREESDITFDYPLADPDLTDTEVSSSVEAGQRDLLLATLPTETLWDEATKAEEAEKSINEALAKYSLNFSSMGIVDAGVLEGYNRLLKRLDKVKTYGLRVCLELETRESLVRGETD